MAISKTIIKMNHMEVVVKVVNDVASPGTVTFGLATDLLKSNEDLSGETPIVNIGQTETSLADGGEATVVRDGVVIYNVFENTLGFEMNWGADTQNNTADIVVNMSTKGTLYIRLLKLQGYRPKFRPEQGVDA